MWQAFFSIPCDLALRTLDMGAPFVVAALVMSITAAAQIGVPGLVVVGVVALIERRADRKGR